MQFYLVFPQSKLDIKGLNIVVRTSRWWACIYLFSLFKWPFASTRNARSVIHFVPFIS